MRPRLCDPWSTPAMNCIKSRDEVVFVMHELLRLAQLCAV